MQAEFIVARNRNRCSITPALTRRTPRVIILIIAPPPPPPPLILEAAPTCLAPERTNRRPVDAIRLTFRKHFPAVSQALSAGTKEKQHDQQQQQQQPTRQECALLLLRH